jgi:hypothetical protein
VLCNAYFPRGNKLCELCFRHTVEITKTLSLCEFYDLMASMEWKFTYTDDHRILDETDAIQRWVLNLAEQSPEHRALFDQMEAWAWNRGTVPMPERP